MTAILTEKRFDFRDFRQFLSTNKLSGYLYSVLKESNKLNLLPSNVIETIHKSYKYQRNQNISLIEKMEELQELYLQTGIEAIFLKGPFLTTRFYGDLGQRASSDIDALINKDDLIHVDQILYNHGFRLRSLPLLGRRMDTYFTHHYEYRRQNTKLDLHWTLQSHFSFNLNTKKIWETKQSYSLSGKRFQVLSNEYEFVLQILSIFMDTQLSTIRMKSILDLYLMTKYLNESLDWDEFFEARKEEGLFRISINVVDLVFSLLNCSTEFQALAEIIDRNGHTKIYTDANKKLRLLNRSFIAFRNKLWAFRLYEVPFWKSSLWWMISLPFKILVYREAFLKPIKTRLKSSV